MRRHQRGAALLIAIALLGLLAIATLARALSSPAGTDNAAQLATERALAQGERRTGRLRRTGQCGGEPQQLARCPALPGHRRQRWRVGFQLQWSHRSAAVENARHGTAARRRRRMSVVRPQPHLQQQHPDQPARQQRRQATAQSSHAGRRHRGVGLRTDRRARGGRDSSLRAGRFQGRYAAGAWASPGCRDGSIEQFIESATIDGTVTYSHVAGSHAITTARAAANSTTAC
jgi:hypothetical protein